MAQWIRGTERRVRQKVSSLWELSLAIGIHKVKKYKDELTIKIQWNENVWTRKINGKLTACRVPYGQGFSEASSANLSCRFKLIKWLSEASFSKASFLSSIIFLSAWVCVWKDTSIGTQLQ